MIYNSDSENVHGFGAGEDATYAETAAGKTFELAEKVRARYVRVYMKGSGSGTTNHIVELEVYGINKEVEPTPDLTALNARIAELEQVSTEGKTTSSAAEFTKQRDLLQFGRRYGRTERLHRRYLCPHRRYHL